MIAMPVSEIAVRANAWAEATNGLGRVIDGESMVGGGSLPGGTLHTKLLAIGPGGKKVSPQVLKLAAALRAREVPIIGRMQDNTLLLDPRTVLPEEDGAVVKALGEVTSENW